MYDRDNNPVSQQAQQQTEGGQSSSLGVESLSNQGHSKSNPLPETSPVPQSIQTNISPNLNLEQLGTLKEILELLEYVKQMKSQTGVSSQGAGSTQVPSPVDLSNPAAQCTQSQVPGVANFVQQPPTQQPLAQDSTLIPSFTLDEYKGKSHVFEFLQYLARQKSVLQTTKISDTQKKVLLNSKLPYYISNNMISSVNDSTISLEQYVLQVQELFGPKKDQVRQQMMSQTLGKYDNYVTFVHKLQQYSQFAKISDQNILFILEQKFPKHVTSFISECNSIPEYVAKLRAVQQEGWYSMVEDQFRKTIPAYKKGEGTDTSPPSNKTEKQVSFANTSISEEKQDQNTTYKNSVVFVDVMENFDSFPVETRAKNSGIKKRQHIDTSINDRFKNQAQEEFQKQEQLRQQQQKFQQQQTQNQTDAQGTSASQQQPQSTGPIQDETIKKLFEKAKNHVQNTNKRDYPEVQNISKGPRTRKYVPVEQSYESNRGSYFQLDPYRYINKNQQTHLTQVFNDVCVPVTLSSFLQLNGFEIKKKQDQTIVPNLAYLGDIAENSYDSTPEPPDLNRTFNEAYTSDSSDVQNFDSENQLFQYFVKNLSAQINNHENNKNKTLEKVTQSSDTHDQMCVILKVNNKPVIGVIDGGASKTIISKQVVEQAGIKEQVVQQPQSGKGIFVSGVSGTERIYGIIPRLSVVIQNFEVDFADVLVQSSTNFQMLIGLDVLGLFDFQVGMKNREVSFIPYPDDPRVYLQLCSKEGAVQNIHKAFMSYVTLQEDSQFLSYLHHVQSTYPDFPQGKTYQLIYADPPWLYEKSMYKTKPNYPCLNYDQLALLPIQSIADKDCILLLWSTGTHVPQALDLIRYWGFKYINFFVVWKKINKKNKNTVQGQGYYSKNCFEVLLIATKGKVANLRRSQKHTVSQELLNFDTAEILEPRSDFFSRKPFSVYQYINTIFKIESMNSIEVFATQRNKYNVAFDLYGNTLQPKFQNQTQSEDIVDVTYKTFTAKPQIQNSKPEIQVDQAQKIKEYCQKLQVPTEVELQQFEKLKTLITKYQDVFKFDNKLSYTNLGEADITLRPHAKPICMKPYRLVGEPYEFLLNKFQELESQGLVSKGKSEWGTAVMVVPKDSPTEKYRAVQNFKKVNQLTVKDKYPLRLIQLILLKLRNKKWYCVIDLKGGFNQIKRSLRSKQILAMILPFGLYIPEVMFFGETNAPSIFQRYLDLAIGDLYGKGIECYIDDIIVYGNSVEEILSILELLFIRLERTNFKLNPEKCTYFVQKATILGHEICNNTLSPKFKKIDKLLKLETPRTKKQLQQYMGSINYYRKFLPELATLFIPFQQALADTSKNLLWGNAQAKSFEIIQSFLKNKLVLEVPDLNKTFKVILSHSENTYAAALLQTDQEGEYVVGFHSQVQVLTKNKLNPYIQEIDCLVWALNEWRPYLQHQHFIVETDQSALKFLYESKTHNLQLINYQLELQDLIFEIQPIKNNRLKQMLLLTYLSKNSELLENTLQNISDLQSVQTSDEKPKKQVNSGTPFEKFEFIMRFDGASIKLPFNTQMGAGAYVVYNNKHKILYQGSFEFPGAQTNNCAEYQALIVGLQFLKNQKLNKKLLLIQGDSQLIIRQINYQYMCNSENLSTLCNQARDLLKQFPQVKIEHIDRNYNVDCDKLAKAKLAKLSEKFQIKTLTFQQNFADLSADIDVIKCKICNQEEPQETMLLCDHCNSGFHTDCINLQDIPSGDWYCNTCLQEILENLQTNTYVDPVEDLILLQYLKGDLQLHEYDKVVQNRVLNRATVYTLINEKLYKISTNNLREVPTVGERTILVEQIHQLVGHLGQNRTVELIKQYYYWPNMQLFIENILRQCLLCQAQNPQYLRMPGAFPIDKHFKPMQILYLDCFYLPKSKQGNRLVVLAICGTSKWVEGRAIKTNNSKDVRDFLFDQIICRYGTPQVIRSDNGPEFRNELSALCQRLGIVQIFSSPYYPQTNGQVERMNRTVKNCIIKLANCYSDNDFDWEDLLPQVLMGVNFTKSRVTKFSAFQTLFGCDPVLPGYQGIQKTLTLSFPNDQEQENYVLNKINYKEAVLSQVKENLQEVEQEIEDVILKREKISSSNLEYGNLVFVKREDAKYPNTKTKGPYIFLSYNDLEKTSAMLINPKNQKIISVNVTKINPIKLY